MTDGHPLEGLLRRKPRIGVIGPGDLVDLVMAVAVASGLPATPVAAAYHSEAEAPALARRLATRCDALVFTGPVPYDQARHAGALTGPALHVPLNGEALYRALLHAVLSGQNLAWLSVDTLTIAEVTEVCAELGLDTAHLAVHPYAAAEYGQDVDSVASFHQRAAAHGATLALTCRRAVHERLEQQGLPAVRVTPARQSIRDALKNAMLLASGTLAQEAQLALLVAEIDRFDATRRAAPTPQHMRELQLDVYRVLLAEARRLSATIVPLGPQSYLLVTTMGALQLASDDWTQAPILPTVQAQTRATLSLGVGAGPLAADAEAHAYRALHRAQALGGNHAVLVTEPGGEFVLPLRKPRQRPRPTSATATVSGLRGEYRRLLAALAQAGDPTPFVVDSSRASRLLGITERSARRALRAMADQGLAWPVPAPATARGRPRHHYRLTAPPDVTGDGEHHERAQP